MNSNAPGSVETLDSIETAAIQRVQADEPRAPQINVAVFRKRLMAWYHGHARALPWRGTKDPYAIWVSEIMLQQTRVAAVIEHYNLFLRKFPSLVSLALAAEPDVLAAWSGLGYYRRARMLHKAAQFIMLEREGRLPTTAAELRTLPGIGEYTAAAIASIAFGEPVAVVDGNVERVILRLTGRANDGTATLRAFVKDKAQSLMPEMLRTDASSNSVRPAGRWSAEERRVLAAAANPMDQAGPIASSPVRSATAGDHNQAMMELGAMVCLPKAPLCLQCPVQALCRTKGEHVRPPRAPQRSLPMAYLLDIRKRGTVTEVLLERRPADAKLMQGMYELPPLPLEAVDGREPVLRVRHAITNTNYYVQVFAPRRDETSKGRDTNALRKAAQKDSGTLRWIAVTHLSGVPLTGLARKILQRLHVMERARIALLEE